MSSLDPTVPRWPRWLAPQTIAWGLTRTVMSGPQPLSGRPQTVVSDMGSWRVTLTGIRLSDLGDSLRAFRAIFFGTLAYGGPVYLSLYDWRRGPRVRSGLSAFPAPIPFSDLALLSDGSAFDADIPTITVAAAAAARATTIVVQTAGDPLPVAGEFIGLGDRAHMVTAVFSGTPGAGQTTLNIRPPLRGAVAIGDPVETVDPVCRMQLDPKTIETMSALDLAIVGNVTLDFYESNWA